MTLKDTTAGGVEAVRAVSNNGKRWRIVPVDGDWEMQPVGHITAGQAERLCKAIEAALVASPAPTPATGVPEGWKIVPPEPTAEMIDAAFGKWRAPGWGLVRGIWKAMLASVPSPMEPGWKPDGWRWGIGTLLRKHSGAWWEGRVVGFYSTIQTPQGYNLQLDRPFGPTQIYPESALEPVPTTAGDRDG